MPHLSIVIPAYNEENRIGRTLTETFDYLDRQNYSSEVIVVNDGSTDHTADEVRKFEASARRAAIGRESRAIGVKAIPCETECSRPRARSHFFDADLATPTSEIVKVVGPIAEGRYDVVFGSRALDRSLIGTHQSFFRETVGRTGNLIQFAFTGLRFKDTQCGFKAFRREAAQSVFRLQRIDGFRFRP